MEVRTKFEIGDKVCYLSQSGIVEDDVVIWRLFAIEAVNISALMNLKVLQHMK